MKNFFGLDIPREARFHEILIHLGGNVLAIEPWVLTVSIITLVVGLVAKKLAPKLPYMIFAMVAGGIVAVLIDQRVPEEENAIRTVGALPASLPPLSLPDLSPQAPRGDDLPRRRSSPCSPSPRRWRSPGRWR